MAGTFSFIIRLQNLFDECHQGAQLPTWRQRFRYEQVRLNYPHAGLSAGVPK
jgi:hypothetical protein